MAPVRSNRGGEEAGAGRSQSPPAACCGLPGSRAPGGCLGSAAACLPRSCRPPAFFSTLSGSGARLPVHPSSEEEPRPVRPVSRLRAGLDVGKGALRAPGSLRPRDLLIVLKKARREGQNQTEQNKKGEPQQNLGSGAAGAAARPISRRPGSTSVPVEGAAPGSRGGGRCAARAPHLP